jgi:dephospho-CoA kinase
VLLVGLTGGIGSGKSTVARMLAERGAVVIDADDLARRAVDAGTTGHAAVKGTFGSSVMTEGGDIDRGRLADLVFHDPDARKKLESIVHPEVARLFAVEAERYRGTDRILVYAVPLLVERGLQGMFDVVVVVSGPEATRVARLAERGISSEAARDRMAAQVPDRDRERVADVVIPNDGTLDDLERRVDELWAELEARNRSVRD